MSKLYNALCEVRTSLLNVIGQQHINGRSVNFPKLLDAIGEEIVDHMDNDDFVDEFMNMTEDQLFDLGFNYLNEEGFMMLIPAWIFPLIPEGVELETVDGIVFILEDNSEVDLYGDSWVNVGFHIKEIEE